MSFASIRARFESLFFTPTGPLSLGVMRVTVGKLGNTSIRYDYHVFADEACAQLALEGSMTVVVVKDGKPEPIPDKMRKALS